MKFVYYPISLLLLCGLIAAQGRISSPLSVPGPGPIPFVPPQVRCISIDDVDNDGSADYVVANPTELFSTGEWGSLRVISGANESVLAVHRGSTTNESFGFNLVAGDFNGNGQQELIVTVGFGNNQRVEVLDMLSGSIVATLIPGLFQAGQLGIGMDAKDIDNDGMCEVLISQVTVTNTSMSSTVTGYVYLFSGGSGTFAGAFTDPAVEGFGESCKFIEDVTNDGKPEIVVSTQYDRNGLAFTGHHAVVDIFGGAGTIHQASGLGLEQIGFGLTLLNDMDGDGVSEYVLTTSVPQSLFTHRLISGASGVEITSKQSPASGVFLNQPIARSIRDLDGDDLRDIVFVHTPRSFGLNTIMTIYSGATMTQVDEMALVSSEYLSFYGVCVSPPTDGDWYEEIRLGSYSLLPTLGPLKRIELSPALPLSAIGNHPTGDELLTVNGSTGGLARRVNLTVGEPFVISFDADSTSITPTDFLIFGLLGVPNHATRFTTSLGDFAFPPSPAFPQVTSLFTLADSTGFDPAAMFNVNPAPYSLVAPIGISFATRFTLQGVSLTNFGSNLFITNAILVDVK